MNLYEVRTRSNAPVFPFSHIVVASNEKQAIRMIVNQLNTTQTVVLYQSSYFYADEIIVDNISEPMILL